MIDFAHLPRFQSRQLQIVSMISIWAQGFQVDLAAIERQIPIAHAWADSNPKRAPKRNMVRFLFNWMTRAQRWGNLVVKQRDLSYKETQAPEDEIMTGDDFRRMREAISSGPSLSRQSDGSPPA